MGKGDKRTKRGKIIAGSFGNSRKHKQKATVTAELSAKKKVVEKVKKVTKPAARKTTKAATKKA